MSAATNQKYFFYCPDSVTKETLTYFQKRQYQKIALTEKPGDFWDQLGNIGIGGVLVLYSHGDTNGPSMVKGKEGKNMTESEKMKFCSELNNSQCRLYLLSCETGGGDFADALRKNNVNFVAPVGNCKVNGGPAGVSLSVFSKDGSGEKDAGWVAGGTLADMSKQRAGKSIPLP